ncbi:hypothetical protein TPHA_0K00220 [Tetrapisispora phaffii CBS 4417]|uniref:Sugar phosphate transporter domain-containing protein n=1 Tax=Tetrapisispora phaffii (strain ATCC 24235 / CBS 4417 / NBRC 1672 / NRRL Y-8282 / UCD 70-5) TaxID=1071381 RepID=G8BZ28_TETPH|nr:hypothetical protein TPHA_0K00220 [Tetrapisispora phaffii CBS 4417]CCE65156.1 hypothetical protein TPHA_0K00220 [Tetrapisispora phaffii CBS 4417]
MSNKLLAVFLVGRYLNSIVLSVYNKWMFDPVNGISVPYPILISSFPQLMLFVLSYTFQDHHANKKNTSQGDHDCNKKEKQNSSIQLNSKTRKFILHIVPIAIATAGDAGFSNTSLKYIPLSIFTIIRSANVVFILLFSVLFNLEQFHKRLVSIIAGIFVGIVIMMSDVNTTSSQITSSDLAFGSILGLVSSCLSGFKIVYTKKSFIGKKSSHHKKVHDPMVQINKISSVAFIILLATSLIVEKPFPNFFNSVLFKSEPLTGNVTPLSIAKGLLFLMFPGVEIFVITYCEFGILQISKLLTLSIAAIAKEIITIALGIMIFKEKFNSLRSLLGMSIILMIVVYYNFQKHSRKHQSKSSWKSPQKKSSLYLLKTNESQTKMVSSQENDEGLSSRNVDIQMSF